MNTAVAASSPGSNQLDIFAIGTDDEMYHKHWGANGWQPAFPAWSNISNHGETFITTPAVVSRGQNLLDVFGVRKTDNVMLHKSWNGSAWSDWNPLGGNFANVVTAPVAVAVGADGMAVFALGQDTLIWHDVFQNGSWTGWLPLGGNEFYTAPAAVSSGLNQIDIFAVGVGDQSMYHNAWNGSQWQGWKSLGGVYNSAPAAAPGEQPGLVNVFALGADNSMQHGLLINGALFGWASLGGVLNTAPTAVSWGPGRIDLFALGNDNGMYHNALISNAFEGWHGLGGLFNSPPAVVSWSSNRLDIFALGTDNAMYHQAWNGSAWEPGGGIWGDLGGIFHIPTPNPTPPPASGLGGNSNYVFGFNCNPILGLEVVVDITEDLVCQSASGAIAGNPDFLGFSFQLNGYSPPGKLIAWQQYVIALVGNRIVCSVNNWASSRDLVIQGQNIPASLQGPRLPAGFRAVIRLQNDASGNITGAQFAMLDNHWQVIADSYFSIASILPGSVGPDPWPFQIAYYTAPLIAFELDIVGPINAETAVLSSGAGAITYTALNLMSPYSSVPTCAELTEAGTAEMANTTYGMLSTNPDMSFLQLFQVNKTGAMIQKKGRLRPPFTWKTSGT